MPAGRYTSRRAPGSDRRSRRARAQPQEHHRRVPARPAGRHHRPVRQRQDAASPSTRSTPRASAATSRACRAYARQFLGQMEKPDVDQIDGLIAGHLDRPEGRQPQPALDRRHGHRDLRPPAPAVRARRASRTARTATRSSARPSSRSSTRSWRCRRGRGCSCSGRSSRTARPRATGSSRRPASRASCASASTARCTTSTRRRRSTSTSATRSRSSSIGSSSAAPRRPRTGRATSAAGRSIPRRARPSPIRIAPRLADSVETALRLGEGVVLIAPATREGEAPEFEERRFSRALLAARTTARRSTSSSRAASRSTRRTAPARRAPASASRLEIDPDLVIPDRDKSVVAGRGRARGRACTTDAIVAAQDHRGRLPQRTAGTRRCRCANLPPEAIRAPALRARRTRRSSSATSTSAARTRTRRRSRASVPNLERRYRETDSECIKAELEKYMVERPCPTCKGKRLRPEALGVTIDGRDISEVVGPRRSRDTLDWALALPSRHLASASGRSPTRCSRRSARGSASSSTSGSTT